MLESTAVRLLSRRKGELVYGIWVGMIRVGLCRVLFVREWESANRGYRVMWENLHLAATLLPQTSLDVLQSNGVRFSLCTD